MIYVEKIPIPAADLGPENPMPDIKNNTYIHSTFEITPDVSDEERTYLGKGMLNTILPYRMQDGYNRERKLRNFKAVILENDCLKAVFLPELGGRMWSLYDKKLNRELLYRNSVFQPGNLGLRNAWFSGGVEFNVGIKGHNPLTCSSLFAEILDTPQGEILTMYEYERIRGVVYSVSAWLPEGSQALYLRGRIENVSNETKPMYWWSNIAVPETVGTRVIVPADDAFLCYYKEDHYLLGKTAVPYSLNTDISYARNLDIAHDFFFKIPPKHSKWIAAAAEDGKGLLQCSTDRLIGRKMFLWGSQPGGRNWNEFLSESGQAYIEIQAGLAHTQLEHIPMPPHSEWSWVEAYTALDADPQRLHGKDWKAAQEEAERCLTERVGDPNKLTFPEESTVTGRKRVLTGSGWGSLEEKIRGERISLYHTFDPQDPDTADSRCADADDSPCADAVDSRGADTAVWRKLLEENCFPEPDVLDIPGSYVTGDFWLNKLKGLEKQNWFSFLHMGVILYAAGDLEAARESWIASSEAKENPWAWRNLAMLAKNEKGDYPTARTYILKAMSMKPDCRSLCLDCAMTLTGMGADEEWLSVYEGLTPELRENGRLKLYRAIALIHLDRLEEATQIINEDFVLPDVKEGELSVSQLWFELYRRLYAKQTGCNDPQKADEHYPLPKKLDFRMN